MNRDLPSIAHTTFMLIFFRGNWVHSPTVSLATKASNSGTILRRRFGVNSKGLPSLE